MSVLPDPVPAVKSTGGTALLVPPDIARWRDGNTGVDYVHRKGSRQDGPHVLVTALMHGNEACGAVALDQLLSADFAPARGTATLAFLNIAAYAKIEPGRADKGRFVNEDMNRVWSPAKLDGPDQTIELARARECRTFADDADFLLDLHSMTEGDTPLVLSGTTAKGKRLARSVGYPATVVADAGHSNGVRLRDYGAFGDAQGERAALLVECGQHFAAESAEVAYATVLRFFAALGMLPPAFAAELAASPPVEPQCFIEVTEAVTIETDDFAFVRPCNNLEIVPGRGTLLAMDGAREIRTPYDDCVPIMPAKKIKRGLTAVRLGRYVAAPSESR